MARAMKQPTNITYDAYGPPAAMIRGLFEYLYRADGLTLVPHIPPGISELQQLDPIRFGNKALYLSTVGSGAITSVRVNGKLWRTFDGNSVSLPYATTPNVAQIVIALGDSDGKLRRHAARQRIVPAPGKGSGVLSPAFVTLDTRAERVRAFLGRLETAGFGGSYEAAHAGLILEAVRAAHEHENLLSAGKLPPLPEASQAAAEKSYVDCATKLCDGLDTLMKSYEKSSDERARKISDLWTK